MILIVAKMLLTGVLLFTYYGKLVDILALSVLVAPLAGA
jgi:hypothetical protein